MTREGRKQDASGMGEVSLALQPDPYLRLVDNLILLEDKSGRNIGSQFASNLLLNSYNQRVRNPIFLDDIKDKLQKGGYTDPRKVYDDLLRCAQDAQEGLERDSQQWGDAIVLEVAIEAEWANDPDLPQLESVSRSAGSNNNDNNRYASAVHNQSVNFITTEHRQRKPHYLNVIDRLVRYKDRQGRYIGEQFRWLPSSKDPAVIKPIKKFTSLEIVRSKIQRNVYTEAKQIYEALKEVFQVATEASLSATQRRNDAVNLQLQLYSMWSSEPGLPPVRTFAPPPAARAPPVSMPSNASSTASARPRVPKSMKLPDLTQNLRPAAGPSQPAAASPRPKMFPEHIRLILQASPVFLAKCARVTSERLNHLEIEFFKDMSLMNWMRSDPPSPAPPQHLGEINHTGLQFLLGLAYKRRNPGLVCTLQAASEEEFSSREEWARRTVVSLLAEEAIPQHQMTKYAEDLVAYANEADDQAIAIDSVSAKYYGSIAMFELQKQKHLPKAAQMSLQACGDTLWVKAVPFFHYFHAAATSLLLAHRAGQPYSGLDEGIMRLQASGAAALLANQVASLEAVLTLVTGSSEQTPAAIETGLYPAAMLGSQLAYQHIIAPPIQPGSHEQPEPPFRVADYATMDWTDESARLAEKIATDMATWNRLTSSCRDYLLGALAAKLQQDPIAPSLRANLARIATFYPEDARMLLLQSAVYLSADKPIVSLFVSSQLFAIQLALGESRAEAATMMAMSAQELGRMQLAGSWYQKALLPHKQGGSALWQTVFGSISLVSGAFGSDWLTRSPQLLDLCKLIDKQVAWDPHPCAPRPLEDVAARQDYLLVKSHICLTQGMVDSAIECIKQGIEMVLPVHRDWQAAIGESQHNAACTDRDTTLAEWLRALHFYVVRAHLFQHGTEVVQQAKEVEAKLARQHGLGSIDGHSFVPSNLAVFSAPEVERLLPLAIQNGRLPALMLLPHYAKSLAPELFLRRSHAVDLLMPPSLAAITTAHRLRQAADREQRAGLSRHLLTLCKVIDETLQQPGNLMCQAARRAIQAAIGVEPSVSLLLYLYYFAYSLQPGSEIIQNIVLLCMAYAEQDYPVIVLNTLPQTWRLSPIEFALVWLHEAEQTGVAQSMDKGLWLHTAKLREQLSHRNQGRQPATLGAAAQ